MMHNPRLLYAGCGHLIASETSLRYSALKEEPVCFTEEYLLIIMDRSLALWISSSVSEAFLSFTEAYPGYEVDI